MVFAKKRKNQKKIWICVVVLLALLIGGALFFMNYKCLFSLQMHSNCKFNPEISEKNKEFIEETIVTVAHEGVFSLMGKEKHLRQIGAIVSSEVSDFAYWAYVFSIPKLAQDMKLIQKSNLKYKGFVKGTGKSVMQEYHENPCFLEQAKGFAHYLKLPEEEYIALLEDCIANGAQNRTAFRKYIDYLIKEKAP